MLAGIAGVSARRDDEFVLLGGPASLRMGQLQAYLTEQQELCS